MVEAGVPLFPSNGVREFSVKGITIFGNWYGGVFQKMGNLSCLRLDRVFIGPALDALSPGSLGLFDIFAGTTLIHPHTHRRSRPANRPQVGVGSPI